MAGSITPGLVIGRGPLLLGWGCLGSFYRLIKKTSVSCFVKLILTLFLMDILFFALEVRFLALECRPDKDLLKIIFLLFKINF
jgi:hypothetical protein